MTEETATKDVEKSDQDVPAKAEATTPPPDSMAKLVGTLTVVAVVAGAALAAANDLTKDRIKAARARVKLAGIQRVLPKCDNDPVKDALKVKGPKGKLNPRQKRLFELIDGRGNCYAPGRS